MAGEAGRDAFTRLVFIGFTLNLGVGVATTLLPIYLNRLGYTATLIGALWFGYTVVYALSSLLSGYALTKLDERTMLTSSLTLYAAAGLAAFLSKTGLPVGMSYLAMGAALGLFTTAAYTAVSEVSPAERLTTMFAVYYTSVLSGASLGSYLSGLVSSRYGFRLPFLILSALAFSAIPASPRVGGSSRRPEEGFNLLRLLLTFWRDRSYRLFLTALTLHSVGFACLYPYIPLYAELSIGMSQEAIGAMMALWKIGLLSTQVLWGRVADRFGARSVLAAHLALSTVTWILFPLSKTAVQAYLTIALIGVVGSMDIPSRRTIIVSEAPPELKAFALGMTDFTTELLSSVGYIIGGASWDNLSAIAPFIIGAVINAATPIILKAGGAARIRTGDPAGPSRGS
mgnify:FL=1